MTLEEAKKLAKKKDPKALCFLGNAYLYGPNVKCDKNLGCKYLKEAANLNYGDANADLGMYLYLHKSDAMKALPYLIKASVLGASGRKGDGVESTLSDLYNNFDSGKLYSRYQSLKWYVRSLEAKDYAYQRKIGLAYRAAVYIKLVKEESFKQLVKDAKNGDIKAIFNLGCYYYNKLNFEDAFSNFLKAAKEGHKVAKYNLATMYSDGLGIKVNHKKAEEWYKEAAKQKFAPAYLMLGTYKFKKFLDEEPGADFADCFKDFEKSTDLGQDVDIDYAYFDLYYNDD